MFLSTASFSYITIFSTTKGALWLKSDDEKSKIISMKEIFHILGVLIASILLSFFLYFLPSNDGYFLYSIIAIMLITISSLFFIKWLDKVNRNRKPKKNSTKFNIKKYITYFDKNGVFLFSAFILSTIGSTLPAVTIVFFSRYVLKTPDLSGLYIFAYFLGGILFIPIIKRIALKFGMIKTWGCLLIFYAVIFAFIFTLSDQDYILFIIACFLAGAGLATELILPNILLAKWIDSHPERRDFGNGYYAILVLIAKFAYAIATIIAFPLMNLPCCSNPQNLEIILRFIYCILPFLAKLSAAIIVFKWYKVADPKLI